MRLGYHFSFWWAVWKEKNHRILEHQEKSPLQLSGPFVEEAKFLMPVFQRGSRPRSGALGFLPALWVAFVLDVGFIACGSPALWS
jgi:hypothetical protein